MGKSIETDKTTSIVTKTNYYCEECDRYFKNGMALGGHRSIHNSQKNKNKNSSHPKAGELFVPYKNFDVKKRRKSTRLQNKNNKTDALQNGKVNGKRKRSAIESKSTSPQKMKKRRIIKLGKRKDLKLNQPSSTALSITKE